MHNLMLVTLAMEHRETSLDARQSVHWHLIDDHSFCGDGGRFGTPVCDWFVIGGRWSGSLRKSLMGEDYRVTLKQRFPSFAKGSYDANDLKAHASGLDSLWHEFGGAGPSPFNRDANEHLGYDDDARPLDRTLYDRFLAEHKGKSIDHERQFQCSFVDLDDEEVDETFIGRKWIVVVDYHN